MVRQRNMLDNRKTQTNAIAGMFILIVATVESFENTVHLIFVNSGTRVFHENGNLIVILPVTECDCSFGRSDQWCGRHDLHDFYRQ